jgi:uncharacterized protein YjiS (DUF1127 family)
MDGSASISRNDRYARPRFTFAANAFSLALASAGRVLRAAILVVRAARQIQRVIRRRRDAHMLARMDAKMLADIGLTPEDVRNAFSEPLWRYSRCLPESCSPWAGE